ncbi:MAG: LamG domain-containing protein [Clostridiaceae bacterium]|nr:LamG domain-containing protein [Clostridiaceae bacterium]
MNGNANDSSGNNNGIVHGATPSVDRFGDTVGSYIFDGMDDYIEIANTPDLNGNRGTICFWARIPYTDESISRAILSKADTARYGYVLSVTETHYYWWNTRTTDTVGWLESGSDIGADFWTEDWYFFIAITFTENETAYYFEGELRKRETYTPDYLFNNNSHDLYIGKSLVSYYQNFRGEIDDLLIYDRALTESEILQLFNWQLD